MWSSSHSVFFNFFQAGRLIKWGGGEPVSSLHYGVGRGSWADVHTRWSSKAAPEELGTWTSSRLLSAASLLLGGHRKASVGSAWKSGSQWPPEPISQTWLPSSDELSDIKRPPASATSVPPRMASHPILHFSVLKILFSKCLPYF